MTGRYLLKTLGCKANLFDSQKIEADLQSQGWLPVDEDSEAEPDLCVVNSCTVTDEADRQSRKTASRLSRDYTQAKVVLTGCAAEVNPELLAKVPGVDFVVGNRDKFRISSLLSHAPAKETEKAMILGVAENYSELLSRHPIDREWPAVESKTHSPRLNPDSDSQRTRSFLKIQDGCNSFCTYCIIPYGRGPSRSLSIQEVLAQVRSLVVQGSREIVLTGINLGEYGTDWDGKLHLAELCKEILDQTPLERLRLGSLDPVEIDDSLIELMTKNSKLCAHFHVSLQSPLSRILKLMKRKYSIEEVRNCLGKIDRIPASLGGVFVGMDLITGFPGETAQDFEETVKELKALPWTRLHVFPYSERAGTPATRLPGIVPQSERSRRAKVLRELSLERMKSVHQEALIQVQKQSSGVLRGVLIENPVRGPDSSYSWASGYTPNYFRTLVKIPENSFNAIQNQVVDLKIDQLSIEPSAGDVSFLGSLVNPRP